MWKTPLTILAVKYSAGHTKTSKYFCAHLQQMLTDFDRNWCAVSWIN